MERITKESLMKMKQNAAKPKGDWIKVGLGTCGVAAGANEVYHALLDEVKKRNLPVDVKQCGCIGMCHAEPLVEVNVEGMPKVFYGKVDKEKAVEIVEKHLCGKNFLDDHIYEIV